MHFPRLFNNRGLVAVAATAGLFAAGAASMSLQAATTPSSQIDQACVAQIGDGVDVSQTVTYSASGPDTALTGDQVALTINQHEVTLPDESSGITVTDYENIQTRVEAYGGTVVSASVTNPGTYPSTVAVAGNVVTVTTEGPVTPGTLETSQITILTDVSAPAGGAVGLAPSAPFYQLTANTGLGAITVVCNPADDTQRANATLTVPVTEPAPPDTEGPTITVDSPYDDPATEAADSLYALDQEVIASYACSDPSEPVTCTGPVANGAPIDTSAEGEHEFTVTATDAAGNSSSHTVMYVVLPAGVEAPPPPVYTPLTPERLLDTRDGIGKQGGGAELELEVAGVGEVGSNATSVVLNVTVTDTEGPGYVTVYPCGDEPPTASNLNYVALGESRANAVVAKVGADGKVCFYTFGGATHLIADVAGYFPGGSQFTSLTPTRLLDTREGGTGAPAAGATTPLVVGGTPSVPANAEAVVLNLTAVDTAGPGYVTAFPAGGSEPNASNVNFTKAGEIVPNLVVVKLGDGGAVSLFSGVSSSHLLADVVGYFPEGADYEPLVPARLLDTRADGETVDGEGRGAGQPMPNEPIELVVGGRHGIPVDAAAAVLNVTATDTEGPGFVTVFPCGAEPPEASNLNYTAAGQTRPNAVFAKLADGKVCLLTAPATAHLIVDVAGYFPAAADQPAESEEPPPTTTTVPGEPTTTTTTVPADTTVPGDTTPTTTAPPEAPAACALYLSQATAQVVYDLAVFLGATDFAATLDLDGDGVACEDYAFPL